MDEHGSDANRLQNLNIETVLSQAMGEGQFWGRVYGPSPSPDQKKTLLEKGLSPSSFDSAHFSDDQLAEMLQTKEAIYYPLKFTADRSRRVSIPSEFKDFMEDIGENFKLIHFSHLKAIGLYNLFDPLGASQIPELNQEKINHLKEIADKAGISIPNPVWEKNPVSIARNILWKFMRVEGYKNIGFEELLYRTVPHELLWKHTGFGFEIWAAAWVRNKALTKTLEESEFLRNYLGIKSLTEAALPVIDKLKKIDLGLMEQQKEVIRIERIQEKLLQEPQNQQDRKNVYEILHTELTILGIPEKLSELKRQWAELTPAAVRRNKEADRKRDRIQSEISHLSKVTLLTQTLSEQTGINDERIISLFDQTLGREVLSIFKKVLTAGDLHPLRDIVQKIYDEYFSIKLKRDDELKMMRQSVDDLEQEKAKMEWLKGLKPVIDRLMVFEELPYER